MICYLDFHKILLLCMEDLPDALSEALKNGFRRFLVEDSSRPPDVIVRSRPYRSFPKQLFDSNKNPEKISVSNRDGRPLVVLKRRSQPCFIIEDGEPLILSCLPETHHRCSVVDAVHHAVRIALWRKGGLLMKGACLCRGSEHHVFCGFSGAGKTSVLLRLINSGWSYLSDDTFLLFAGRAYAFRRHITFNLHHLEEDPDLFAEPVRERYRWSAPRMRSLLRNVLGAILPETMMTLHSVKKLYDPYCLAEPNELAPTCEILQEAMPRHWSLLIPSDVPVVKAIDRGDFIDRMESIHMLTYPDFETIRHQLNILGHPLPGSWRDLMERNIQGGTYVAGMSWRESRDAAVAHLLDGLDRLISADMDYQFRGT